MATTINFANVNNTSVTNARKSLKAADKEAKSLSGCIKVILDAEHWNKGYKEAFAIFGITAENLTPKNVFDAIPANLKKYDKDESGKQTVTVSKWVKVFEYATTQNKNKSKTTITYKMYKGKRVYKWEKSAITTWTPTALFGLLVQVAETKGAMPEYSDNMDAYWKAVEAAKKSAPAPVDAPVSAPVETPAPVAEAPTAPTPAKGGKRG